MVVTVVQIPMAETMSRERHCELAKKSATNYQNIPGLIRKYYIFSGEQSVAGGAYLWESREAAEACFNGSWRKTIKEIYGSGPKIDYYDCPVVVDNALGEIESKRPTSL